MGHFGVKKTEDVLATHFFWRKMRRDVEHFVARCTTCQKAKSKLYPHGLYMPLHVPSVPWEDISFDLVLGYLEQRRGGIANLLSQIDFWKRDTSYHVLKAMMLLMLLICSSVKLFVCMVCLILLFQIVILNFLATFGDVYGLNWGLNCFLELLVTPN